MTGSCGGVRESRSRCACPDGRFRKIFEIFSEIRGQNTICLAITPIEGHLVTGRERLCFKKAGKTLIVFKKNPNIRYGSFLKKVEKKGE